MTSYSAPRKQSKTYKVPKRPYEAARLDAELKVGSFVGWGSSWVDLDRGDIGMTWQRNGILVDDG